MGRIQSRAGKRLAYGWCKEAEVAWDSWSRQQPLQGMKVRKPERRTKERSKIGNSKLHRLLRYIQFSTIRRISKRDSRYVPQRVCGWGSAKGAQAHELMERLANRFALDKQKTTECVQTEYNDWKIESGKAQCRRWIGCVKDNPAPEEPRARAERVIYPRSQG